MSGLRLSGCCCGGRDGELTRVGDAYLHRGRDHATEPIEELVVTGLLADPDPAAEAIRLVLTDAGCERFAELAPPGADEPRGVYVHKCCGHRVLWTRPALGWAGPRVRGRAAAPARSRPVGCPPPSSAPPRPPPRSARTGSVVTSGDLLDMGTDRPGCVLLFVVCPPLVSARTNG